MDRGIYQTILVVLAINIVIGVLLTFAGERYFGDIAYARFGTGLALVAGAIYFFFRLWGRRRK